MQVQRSPSIRQRRSTMAAAAPTTTEQVTWEVVNGSYSSVSNILQRATPAIVNGFDRRNYRGWTALQLAIYYDKSYSTVDSLLGAGADPNIAGPSGPLPLCIAIAEHRSYSTVSSLLSAGANANIVGPGGRSLLHIAIAEHRSYSLVSSLLTAGANPNIRGPDGKFPLYIAIAENRSYSTVSSLISAGANANIVGPDGRSLLYVALTEGRSYSTISSLLSAGADPNIAGPDGSFPLNIAIAKRSSYSTLSSLISSGANPNVQDPQGKTPLMNLLQFTDTDHSNSLEALVEARGFDPNVSDGNGLAALHYLAHYGIFKDDDTDDEDDEQDDNHDPLTAQIRQMRQRSRAHLLQARRQQRETQRQLNRQLRALERQMHQLHSLRYEVADDESSEENDDDGDGTILSALIRKGANVNATDSRGRTPLFYAAQAGHLEVLVGLLQAGADPNDATKLHPLRIAIYKGHVEIVEALLQGGSTAIVTEAQQRKPIDTCLHLAARGGKDRIVGLLLHAGANPNAINKQHQTPLFSAIGAGCLSSVEAIISAGANVNATDRNHGDTPLHWAATRAAGNKISILDVLFQSGADAHKQNNFGRTPLMEAAVANVDLNILYFFLEKDPTQVVVTTHAPNLPPIVPERQPPTRRSRRLRGEDPEPQTSKYRWY